MTASTTAEVHHRSIGTVEGARDQGCAAFESVARVVPLKYEGGRAFIPFSRDQRFEVGLQLSHPNAIGVATEARW